jgi:hypothetical protein
MATIDPTAEDTALNASVDVASNLFQLPEGATDDMYAVIKSINVTDLTTGAIDGTGAFDLIMASVKAQIDAEFENGRITGSEYTSTYIQLTQSALQVALQFVMQRQQAFWASQTGQIQAITGRIALETSRFTYQNVLPAQLQQLFEQGCQARAQTSDTRLDGANIAGVMGAQQALYKQQVISYQRDAECKAAKIFTDAWITQKTIDSGLLPPVGFTNDSVNEILTVIMANNAFGAPVA